MCVCDSNNNLREKVNQMQSGRAKRQAPSEQERAVRVCENWSRDNQSRLGQNRSHCYQMVINFNK